MASAPLNWLLKIGGDVLNTAADTLSAAINELQLIVTNLGIDLSDVSADMDKWTTQVVQADGKVVFDNLDPTYGYDLHYDTNATGDITIPRPINVNRSNGTNTGTIKLTYTMYNGVDGVSRYKLRIIK